ncbi:MAG: hypothetical protein KDC51_05870, partial [Flavobacteriaceae bacterium]|nr:hypothetical protein [Flavobacteriaceae bacterium]
MFHSSCKEQHFQNFLQGFTLILHFFDTFHPRPDLDLKLNQKKSIPMKRTVIFISTMLATISLSSC